VRRLLIVVGLGSTVACGPYLDAVTAPPPHGTLELDPQNNRIHLSEGTAVAFECRREGGPCRDVHTSVERNEVAAVYMTHLARLNRYWGTETNVSALTLVGLKPGTTRVRVSSDGWTNDYTVTVVAGR
jgi:hypothetical protein